MSSEIVEYVKSNLDEILEGNAEKMVECADKFGQYLSKDERRKPKRLTTSQIRGIFSQVQRMHGFDSDKLNLLRPHLAYAAGRHRDTKVKDLQDVLDTAIQKVDNERHFKNFKKFFEAILAYHKFHGGE
ncbi:MAG: type III-A CRISPR-associated protein Csm2 [Candidatus Aenigmatarchaeota archaeon]|nr:type III-A CRISPR-associated protein Csm2 [Methanothermobacter sp.]